MLVRPGPAQAPAVAAALSANLLIVVLALHAPAVAIAAALAPVAVAAFVALAASDRSVLVVAAFALPVSLPVLNRAIALGSLRVFASDIVIALAVGAWAVGRLTGAPAARRVPDVLRIGFPVFALLALVAAERGHAAYGTSLAGEPLRLVVYAAIALATLELSAEKAFRGLGVVLYAGAFWSLLSAAYYLATGTSQTQSDVLSTGGTRVISLSVSLYLAAAFFYALICFNLRRTQRERLLDGAAAVAALTGIVLSFGRGTFLAVALVGPVLFLAAPHLRSRLVKAVPALVPVALLAGLLVVAFAPGTLRTFTQRIQLGFVSGGSDASVEWRQRAADTIWEQVRESPLTGVGFGRGGTFDLNGVEFHITQDPHNSFVWLAAGGGYLLLGAFLGMLLVYVVDIRRRYRRAGETERALLLWCALTLAAFMLNALAGPLFSSPAELLAIWTLLLLPGIVPLRPAAAP